MRAILALLLVLAVAAPARAPTYEDLRPGGTSDTAMPGNHTGMDDGGNTGGGMHGEGRATRSEDEQAEHGRMAWVGLAAMARMHGMERAEGAHLFAPLTAADGQATGRFVGFGYNATGGELTGYAARELNATFFDLVHAEGFVANGTPAAQGALFRMPGDGASFAAHNNPTAQLDVRGANLTVHLDLGPGVNGTNVTGNRSVRLNAANGQHGHLLVVGDGTLATTASGFEARLVDGGVLFLAHPTGSAVAGSLHDVIAGAAGGRIGAVGAFVDADGSPLDDSASWGVLLRAVRSGDRSLVVNISSDDPAGKAVVVRTDNATVPAGRAEDVLVTLDGAAVDRTRDAIDAIENGTRGAHARSFVTLDSGGIQVVVGVPHYSAHLLAISSALPAPQGSAGGNGTTGNGTGGAAPPKATPDAALPVALVTVAGLALLRRRRA
ncbi:MAG: PDZ domain-containing protein [Halobacteriales archaeon]|nr:PDZ domain-containing protein [Halobacteriales archaeon]